MTDELKPLSKKHQRVLDEYFLCWSQWRSYHKVFPKVTVESARTLSSRLFADVDFLAHLQKRLDDAHMSANEALKLQADIARGDLGDFMAISKMGFSLDLEQAREEGKTKLIKKIKQRTTIFTSKKPSDEDREIHETEFELYPADIAQERILKIHGKLKGDAPIINFNKGYIGISPDDWKKDDSD